MVIFSILRGYTLFLYKDHAVELFDLDEKTRASGIFPGENLIVSFESSGVVISDKLIKQMITKYLF